MHLTEMFSISKTTVKTIPEKWSIQNLDDNI